MGDTYQSVRLLVRRPADTKRYRQNRPSAVDFERRQSIEGEIDRRRLIEGEKGKKKKRQRRKKKEEEKKKEYLVPPSLARREISVMCLTNGMT
ncbi:hypothetical protein GW17_00044603 [Ensete ventricosum]|nr:hypothetical protein GW17_00044603 [Ensete ventricosum]